MRWMLCTLVCNFFICALYMIVFGMGLLIDNKDDFENLTPYTQAIDDWGTGAWAEFRFGSGSCPEGFERFSNEWLGTVEGNYTDNGVKKDRLSVERTDQSQSSRVAIQWLLRRRYNSADLW